MIRPRIAFCLVAVLFLAGSLLMIARRDRPVNFDSIDEVLALADATRLHWHTANRENVPSPGLRGSYVSEGPLHWERLKYLQTPCATKPADWQGVVFMIQIDRFKPSSVAFADTAPILVCGPPRCWGNVIVGGDTELMDRIELEYRNR